MSEISQLYQQVKRCLFDGEWQKIACLCQQAVRLNPRDGNIYKHLGYALQMQGKLLPAIRAYGLSCQCDRSLFPAEKFYDLGLHCYRRGAIEAAIACYEQAVKIEVAQYQTKIERFLQKNSDGSGWTEYLDLALLGFHQALNQDSTFSIAYDRWSKSLPDPDAAVLSRLQFLHQVQRSPQVFPIQNYITNYISEQVLSKKAYREAIAPPNNCVPDRHLLTEQWYIESREDGREYQQLSRARSICLAAAKTIAPLEKDMPFYFKDATFTSPQTFVATIPNGRMVWGVRTSIDKTQTCAILTADDRLLSDISSLLPITAPTAAEILPERHWIFRQGYNENCTDEEGTIAVLAELNDCSPSSAPNYFHWFVDTLPRIDLLYRSHIDLKNIDRFLFSKFSASFQKETLELLNFPVDRIWDVDNYPHIRARQLVVPSFAGKLTTIVPRSVQFLRDSFLPYQRPTQFGDRIYISRENARYRRVINEDEVMEVLQKFGFEIVAPESLSFRQQVALFNGAKIIISPHGAGLTNIVFCEPKTTIVEIFAPGYMMQYYWIIANIANLNYYYITGIGLPDPYLQKLAYPNPQMEDICVNISYLLEVLKLAGIR